MNDRDLPSAPPDVVKRVTQDLISDLVRGSKVLPPYGIVDSTKFDLGEVEPLKHFSEISPYGHLIKGVRDTLFAVEDSHRKHRQLSPDEKDAYEQISAISQGGIAIMGLTLELIPVVHLQQFPQENPSAEELAQIAENSFHFVASLANQPDNISIPMVYELFGKTKLTTKGLVGNLRNWRVTDPIPPSLFHLVDHPRGKQLVPKDLELVHQMATDYANLRGEYNPTDHCIALEVQTAQGDSAIHAVWELMINAATKWHYVHTIPKMREAQAA